MRIVITAAMSLHIKVLRKLLENLKLNFVGFTTMMWVFIYPIKDFYPIKTYFNGIAVFNLVNSNLNFCVHFLFNLIQVAV